MAFHKLYILHQNMISSQSRNTMLKCEKSMAPRPFIQWLVQAKINKKHQSSTLIVLYEDKIPLKVICSYNTAHPVSASFPLVAGKL